MIVISTHYDDGVGSCAASLLRCLAAGEPARVWTVMSRAPLLPFVKHFALSLTDWRPGEPAWLRAREDYRACRRLGVERRDLGFVDALYRRAPDGGRLYRDGAALQATVHALDEPLAASVADAIAGAADRLETRGRELLAFPLAIGLHVDHQICARAGQLLLARGRSVAFYRDFFYSGARPAIAPQPEAMRLWRCRLDEAELSRKIDAFEAYSSQIVPLYGSLQQMRQSIRERESVEEFWTTAATGAPVLERIATAA